MCSVYPNTTIRSTKSCNVQPRRPSDGCEQANIISLASTSPSISVGRPERSCSPKAACKPPATNRCRTRETVRALTNRSSPIVRLELLRRVFPPLLLTLLSAASSKICALVCTRAELLPARTRLWSCSRSSRLSRIAGAVFILEDYHYGQNFVGKVLSEAEDLRMGKYETLRSRQTLPQRDMSFLR